MSIGVEFLPEAAIRSGFLRVQLNLLGKRLDCRPDVLLNALRHVTLVFEMILDAQYAVTSNRAL